MVIYRKSGSSGPIDSVAIKQLYASHYFQTALDLSVCAKDDAHPDESGFYLIAVNGSRQSGLGPERFDHPQKRCLQESFVARNVSHAHQDDTGKQPFSKQQVAASLATCTLSGKSRQSPALSDTRIPAETTREFHTLGEQKHEYT
jgi:hypothetical protein